jgi:hypothetical protein
MNRRVGFIAEAIGEREDIVKIFFFIREEFFQAKFRRSVKIKGNIAFISDGTELERMNMDFHARILDGGRSQNIEEALLAEKVPDNLDELKLVATHGSSPY